MTFFSARGGIGLHGSYPLAPFSHHWMDFLIPDTHIYKIVNIYTLLDASISSAPCVFSS